jgi:hypothetical protein
MDPGTRRFIVRIIVLFIWYDDPATGNERKEGFAMYRTASEKIIDLTPLFRQRHLEDLRLRACTVLALWTQYASLGALAVYFALRLLLCPGVPLGYYVGPLFLFWPLSFFLLLTSYVSDLLLWRE